MYKYISKVFIFGFLGDVANTGKKYISFDRIGARLTGNIDFIRRFMMQSLSNRAFKEFLPVPQ